MEYLFAFILVIFAIAFNKRMAPSVRVATLIGIFTYVVVLLGLRYRVGIDTINYMHSFKSAIPLEKLWHSNIFEERFEPGYVFVSACCKSVTSEFWLMQLIMTAITTGCVFIFLYRYCKNPFVGVFLYFILQCLYFSTEIMRESAAVGIFLLNFRNLQQKKWNKYYFFSLFSIAFHYSAIIIWLIPLARFLKPNFLYMSCCIGIIAITPIVETLNDMLAIASITDRVNGYIYGAEKLTINWRLGEMIKSGIPALLALYFIPKKNIPFGFKQMILLQILFCAGTFAIPIIFQRFINYTSLFTTVILANSLSSSAIKTYIRSGLLALIIISQLYSYWGMYRRWMPYVSILNPIHINERENLWWQFNH